MMADNITFLIFLLCMGIALVGYLWNHKDNDG